MRIRRKPTRTRTTTFRNDIEMVNHPSSRTIRALFVRNKQQKRAMAKVSRNHLGKPIVRPKSRATSPWTYVGNDSVWFRAIDFYLPDNQCALGEPAFLFLLLFSSHFYGINLFFILLFQQLEKRSALIPWKPIVKTQSVVLRHRRRICVQQRVGA